MGCGGAGGLAAADWGGPWVERAGPEGLVTLILISSFRTPSTAATAERADRTSVAGSSGASRKVNETCPCSVTERSRIMPADSRSFSSRGFWIRARAAVTRASRDSGTWLHRLDVLYLWHHLTHPGLDPLLQGDGRGRAAVAGA